MAAKIIMGKSVNSNLGHSGGKFGLWIARAGEEDVTTCTKDELIFSTDTFGNASGAVGIGQFQVMPHSGVDADQEISVAASGTTAVSYTDFDIGINWIQSFKSMGMDFDMNGTSITQFQNTEDFGGQSGVTVSNTGNTTFTATVVVWKGFSTNALF